VKAVILLYLLFALTVSTILTALFAGQAAPHRQGHIFLFFFVLLLIIAGVSDVWLVPIVASEQRSAFYPAVLLTLFCAVLTASVLLSVRSPRPLTQAAAHHDTGLDAESAVFGSLVWLAMLVFGIAVLKTAVG
jgi:hypothetical protein